MKKSIGKNVLLNSVRTILSLLFPLITYPYITRILNPEGIGQINFSNSIANYFMLLSALGISTYAVREGAKIRDKNEEFVIFSNSMLTINIISCGIAYIILIFTLFLVPNITSYRLLIFIFSLEMIFKAIGIEWYYIIYEDFLYITIRSIVFQILSLLCLFALVKNSSDVEMYAMIQVISCAGSNLMNLIHIRKKINLKLEITKKLWVHIVPILLIFSTTLATTIYINSDITMLGFISGDIEVGFYSVATKLYKIIKSVINSIVAVYSARLCFMYYKDKLEYRRTTNEVFQLVTGISIPVAVGGCVLSKEIILILGGNEYMGARNGMILLLISIIPATLGNLLGTGALLVVKKEKIMLIATTVGAILNISINFVFIPLWACTGAAITTLITEIVVCCILFVFSIKYAKPYFDLFHIIKVFLSCICFYPIYLFFSMIFINIIFRVIFTIVFSVIAYVLILIFFKNELICKYLKNCKTMFP